MFLSQPARAVLRRAAVHRHDRRPGRLDRPVHPAGGRRPARTSARPRPEPPRSDDRARAILDLQEGRGPVPVLDDAGIAEVLRETPRRIAVVGASSDRPGRRSASSSILVAAASIACRSTRTSGEVHGVPAFPTLAEAVGRDRAVRHRRRVPALRPVRAARGGGRRDRCPLPVAAARRRVLGGGADRGATAACPWSWTAARRSRSRRAGIRGRPACALAAGRRGRAVSGCGRQRIRKPRKTRTKPTTAMRPACWACRR